MVKSILLGLNGDRSTDAVIRVGVEVAQRLEARVRGVAVVDTRQVVEMASTCEGAGYAASEWERIRRLEASQDAQSSDLQIAGLVAGVDSDVKLLNGDPLELLPLEARYHDLTVLGWPNSPDNLADSGPVASRQLSGNDLFELAIRGVQPLLVIPENRSSIERVLLTYDGTVASGMAVRKFLNQGLFPEADKRLVVFGRTNQDARQLLDEMSAYCDWHGIEPEVGYLCGSMRRQLSPYAGKWNADLVVLGLHRRARLVRKFLGENAVDLLRHTECAVYLCD